MSDFTPSKSWDWNQAAQGAGGGAAVGSAAGPYGALIGGAAGGLLGGLGGGGQGAYEGGLDQLANYYGGRQAPINSSGAAQASAPGAGLIAQLQAGAAGQGPSAAALQMREAMDRAAGAQASAAAGAGGRGVNQGAALRNASNNTAAIQAQGARDTGIMRSNEQLQAIQQLLAARGQDIGLNQFNAGQQNQMTMQNQNVSLNQQQLNQQAQLQALMLAMKAAGPGIGTQLLAGGASAMPSILKGSGGGGDGGGGGGA